jgi:hypothetical protein
MFYDFVPAQYHSVSGSGGRETHWTKKDTLMLAVKYKDLLESGTGRASQERRLSTEASIRDRLEQLRQLHKEGLIPEAQYQEKLKELMNQL